MTIRVGTIGASFAKAAYLPALSIIDDVELVAISSARLASAQATADLFNIPNVYDDWEKMINEHELDLVCIATPTIYHAPMALKALNAGAHVLCEKPMAMNQSESANMLETAESLNKIHIIGHELRFNPTRKKIKDLIESGYVGDVRHVNIVNISPSWGNPASRPEGDWWSLESMGGGRLGANGSHQIDLLRFWFGDIGAISGQVATMVPNRIGKDTGNAWTATADDQSSFLAEMQNGALCTVFMSGVARHNIGNHTQIFGSEGTIMLSNHDEKLWIAKAGDEYEDASVSDPNAELEGINSGIWNVSFVALMQELTSAIRDDRKLTQGATFADGHQCQIAMDAVRQSSTERRWIDLS